MQATPYGKSAGRVGWIFVLPCLVFFALFLLFPIGYNIINSLLQTNTLGNTVWIGLQNYVVLARDAIFWTAFRNSLIWVVVTTFVQMALGFFIALLLERTVTRGRAIYRTLLFLPMAITPTVIALVFQNIYAPQYGLLFGLFQQVGLAAAFPTILGDPRTATYAIILVNVWQWIGFYVLMYSVGIANIDGELLAAASVDGAMGWSRIRHIYFPLVRSTHLSLLILGPIQALQQFPLIYLLTNGGPANSTQVMATYIFQKGYVENNMQYASAISIILLLVALLIAGGELLATHGEFAIGGGEQHA
jgi:raffinose/stachyose/melibiose transport system permease protein